MTFDSVLKHEDALHESTRDAIMDAAAPIIAESCKFSFCRLAAEVEGYCRPHFESDGGA